MDNVKLTYFAMKGTGEGIRLLLAYGGQEFEDIQIKLEEWMDFKPKTPHGTLPLFEFNGKLHTQSTAIARFLGHRYGLAGDNLEEDLLIDQNFDFFLDVRMRRSETQQSKSTQGKLQESEHHFEKRSADYDEDDFADGFVQAQRPYENSFDRPHRIRVLPGFLH
ncbi:PREDICTED: glutathione S-transferase 2-like [Papilio polytes]|uniref:glutathione S-transferase 2-like n=1 Tax=Papilio polytes TaxID=76194 RepID=UPI0006766FA1|nr:PREDICTED: glutathione S-transferase 2-like [Papilio polytes]